MIKKIIRRYFAKLIYPTSRNDWYKHKGYLGASHQERFNDFVAEQRKTGALYYAEFKSLTLTRRFIDSSNFEIDCVELAPSKLLSKNKSGNGLYILCFQGRREYYESRFRDMSILARETGATVIGFNPKGFNSSTGKTKILNDIVEDGVVLIEYLLKRNIPPYKIILYGNSLGGGIQEQVCQYFRKLRSIEFRQINSNSFRSLAAVIAANWRVPFLEKKLACLMKNVGWELNFNNNFYKTGLYRCYLYRRNDKTIKPGASYYSKINIKKDLEAAPQGYRETLQWLNDNSELIYPHPTRLNPHNLSLYNFYLKALDEKNKNLPVWYFINKYLETSNKFISKEN